MNPTLETYVETQIIPRYRTFDRAHGTDHVRAVINRSLALAEGYDVDPDMVYAIAAFHDTGLVNGRENHHLDAARILAGDPVIRTLFTAGQIAVMCEAVEDHRASNTRAPRTIYGRIVAEADREIDAERILRRTILYGLDRCPGLDVGEHYARCRDHLMRKYADGGYLRLWIPESDNARRLEELREVLRDERRLRSAFDRIFDQLRRGEEHPETRR